MQTLFPTLLLSAALLLAASPTSTHAATETWDGSASGLWATAANWAGNVAPVNGDALVFPAGPTRLLTHQRARRRDEFHVAHAHGRWLRAPQHTTVAHERDDQRGHHQLAQHPARPGAAARQPDVAAEVASPARNECPPNRRGFLSMSLNALLNNPFVATPIRKRPREGMAGTSQH